MYQDFKDLFTSNFLLLQDFFFDIAALDRLIYPKAKLRLLSKACQDSGYGLLKIDAKVKKGQKKGPLTHEIVLKDLSSMFDANLGRSEKEMVTADNRMTIATFFLHLIKISKEISNEELSVKDVFEKLITEDIPNMHHNLAHQKRMFSQVSKDVYRLPYDENAIHENGIHTSESFRVESLHFDKEVTDVLDLYQDLLF